jgi:hypothetical protein
MRRTQKGVAIVEFALILPFLLLLTFITTEFGRAIWEYNTLTKSVRDAARYLSTRTPSNPADMAKARNLLVYGNLAGTGSPLLPGLSLAHVTASGGHPDCCSWQYAGTAPVINTVTVRISGYTFNSMFGTVMGLPFGQVPFSDITATMRSYL